MYRGRENRETARHLTENGTACIVVVYGYSLAPVINSAQAVVVEPLTGDRVIEKGDFIFCKLRKGYRIQQVLSVKDNDLYSVGNIHGYENGTVSRQDIYGGVVRILRKRRPHYCSRVYATTHCENLTIHLTDPEE